MIYELFLLCSFKIVLDFCSALFKAVERSDFLKNMVLKSALNLNIWKTSVKVNPYGRSGPSLIPTQLGPRSFYEFVRECMFICVYTILYVSFVVEVHYAGFCFCYSFQGENLEYQF